MSDQNPHIRAVLAAAFRTTDDFDAFCIDYFPNVKSRFSAGMNRLQKENLLIEMAGSERLLRIIDKSDSVNKKSRKPISLALFAAALLVIASGYGIRNKKWIFLHNDKIHFPDTNKLQKIENPVNIRDHGVTNTGNITTGDNSPVRMTAQGGSPLTNTGNITTGDNSAVSLENGLRQKKTKQPINVLRR